MDALSRKARAYGVGFARGIGKDLVNGNGTSQPQGILTAAGEFLRFQRHGGETQR